MSGEALFEWIEGDLVISEAVLHDVEAHALESYPSECCGFLQGPAGEPRKIDQGIRAENEADKYHALDPETFPRTSKTYFKINELKASRLFEQGQREGQPVKVIYHSHCDAGAYFSAEDAATFARDNQLQWPCAFLVVSVQDGKLAERKLWVHEPCTNGFRESPYRLG